MKLKRLGLLGAALATAVLLTSCGGPVNEYKVKDSDAVTVDTFESSMLESMKDYKFSYSLDFEVEMVFEMNVSLYGQKMNMSADIYMGCDFDNEVLNIKEEIKADGEKSSIKASLYNKNGKLCTYAKIDGEENRDEEGILSPLMSFNDFTRQYLNTFDMSNMMPDPNEIAEGLEEQGEVKYYISNGNIFTVKDDNGNVVQLTYEKDCYSIYANAEYEGNKVKISARFSNKDVTLSNY